ncbi:major facilitator superfamily domain-containing protein [Aspergillus heterothallicus]
MDHRSSIERADDVKLEAAATGIEDVKQNAASYARDKLSLRQLVADSPAVHGDATPRLTGAVLSVPSFRRAFGYVENGAFFSAFFCSWIGDRIGRKGAMLIGLLLLTGGVLGEMFTLVYGGFVAVKILLGCGLGFMLTLAPLATSEITPVALRGLATSGVNLGIAIGQLLSSAVIKGFGEREDNWGFRGPFAVQLVFIAFLFGRREEAARSLRRLYGPKADIEAEVAAIERTVIFERENSPDTSLLQCFRGTDLQRSVISMGVFVCQHASEIIFVLGYSTYFFQLAGLPDSKSFNLGVGVTACGVAGNIVNWFVVNSLGRRTVFLTGMVSLLTILLLIGIMDAAVTVIYNFASSAALRAHTTGLAAATQSVLGVAMNFACPYMVNPDEGNLQEKVGFVFGGLCLFATIWSFFYVPELKGRSMAEIDELFHRDIKPRKMGAFML